MTTAHPGETSGDPERTGPVAAEVIADARAAQTVDEGTGPVPVSDGERVADPGSTTIRYPVREGASGQNPLTAGSASAAYGTDPGSASHGIAGSGRVNQGQAQRPIPAHPAHPTSAHAHPAHADQSMSGSAASAPGDPHAGYAPAPPKRRANRDANVVAFVLNQFPIGHMPVATPHPDRQVRPPEAVAEHPHETLIRVNAVLTGSRSGQSRAPVRDTGAAVPNQLLEGYQPHGDLGELEWERTYRASTGLVWPETQPDSTPEVLEPGTVIDRVGSGFGRVLTADGTRFDQRGVPHDYAERDYHRYRVEHSLPVWQDSPEAWFGQPGGAVRYRTTRPVVELVALGYLLDLTARAEDRDSSLPETREASEESAPTVRIGSANAETLRLSSTRTAEEDNR